MHEPKSSDEFNLNGAISEDEVSQLVNLIDRAQAENLSVRNVASHQEKLKKLFFQLIALGLGIGVLTATVVVWGMKKGGLAGKPNQINIRAEQQQVNNNYSEELGEKQ